MYSLYPQFSQQRVYSRDYRGEIHDVFVVSREFFIKQLYNISSSVQLLPKESFLKYSCFHLNCLLSIFYTDFCPIFCIPYLKIQSGFQNHLRYIYICFIIKICLFNVNINLLLTCIYTKGFP